MSKHVWADPDSFVRSPAEAAAVLRDLNLPRVDQYIKALAETGGLELADLQRLSRNTLVAMSGEDHLKTRRVIAPFFSRAGLVGWRPMVAQATQAASDGLASAHHPDLVKDFSVPLFLKVLPKVLGMAVSPTDAHFHAVETVQRLTEPYLSVPTLKALNQAVGLLVSTCPEQDEIGCEVQKDGHPESLLRYLYRRRDDLPDGVDPRYLVLGLLAGANSATQSLAFALYGLLSGPGRDWKDAAKEDWPEQQGQKVLGLYQSTRTLVRIATQSVQISGCPYQEGQTAVVDIVAANACLREQNNPRSRHMSFGSGPHKCPGSRLSEMLIEMVIPALARRFPDFVLRTEQCRFVTTPMMQAPTALPCDLLQVSQRVTSKLCDIRDMESARNVLRDDEVFAPPPMAKHLTALADKSGRDFGTAIRIARNALFFMDGPRHQRLRTSITQHLGGPRLDKWGNVMDVAIDQALSGLEQMSDPDLVCGLSDPVRHIALASVLGITTSDPQRFHDIAPGLQQVLEPWLPLRDLERVQAIFAEALSLMTLPPASDDPPSLLAAMLADPPDGFDTDDLKAVALVLYGASFNLSHTLANILHCILIRPRHERRGIDQPAWIDGHMEELISFCSGPKYIYRMARRNLSLGDLAIQAGDTARLVVHGINQQTRARTGAGAGHVSFGHGLHRCVGAGLSRMAIRRVVPALFARFPDLSLIAQSQAYFPMSQTVALRSLPCALNR